MCRIYIPPAGRILSVSSMVCCDHLRKQLKYSRAVIFSLLYHLFWTHQQDWETYGRQTKYFGRAFNLKHIAFSSFRFIYCLRILLACLLAHPGDSSFAAADFRYLVILPTKRELGAFLIYEIFTVR